MMLFHTDKINSIPTQGICVSHPSIFIESTVNLVNSLSVTIAEIIDVTEIFMLEQRMK